MNWRIIAVFLLASFFLLAGCISTGLDIAPTGQALVLTTLTAVPSATNQLPTATATLRPTQTATATPSPTPTMTPTPTALPITVSGNPRAAISRSPEPQDNTRCGLVDFLDFPLDPPDALNVSYGGRGFANFRSRYDQYHAGEDWQLVRGRANLGVPVYAIGHGRVTYAHPYGWGTDQGVIIIRHTFGDGSTVLSFYGHMDPDSVTLRAGDCVVRGQKIAEIGQPRTPPHLHFEVRTHLPDEPGPGYWPVDPTEAGWLPPSQFVWQMRMAAMPGVKWTRPFTTGDLQNIGVVNENTLILREDEQLLGLDVADGRIRWQRPITETVTGIMLDAGQSLLYLVGRSGEVAAYPFLEAAGGLATLADEPLWQVDLERAGVPTLLPLPGGGVVVSARQDLTAVSANGDLLWQAEIEQRRFDWHLTTDHLILTGSGQDGPVYSLTAAGLQTWPVQLHGRVLSAGDQIWLYAEDGLYRLDPAALTAELLAPLPPRFVDPGSIVALPDGSVMIAHRELGDTRLIIFNSEGTVLWQRSIAELGASEPRLLLHNDQPYLLLKTGREESTQLKLYAVDWQHSMLHHIFTGGTRTPLPRADWTAAATADLLLLNIGGGSMVMLDPATAAALINNLAN